MTDILTAAMKIHRNLKRLTLPDQKAVIDFVRKSLDQKEQAKASAEVAEAVAGSTAADAGVM